MDGRRDSVMGKEGERKSSFEERSRPNTQSVRFSLQMLLDLLRSFTGSLLCKRKPAGVLSGSGITIVLRSLESCMRLLEGQSNDVQVCIVLH